MTGVVGMGMESVSRLSDGPGVRTPLALLGEGASKTLRNEGEGGKGTAVGDAGQEDESNKGFDASEGGSGKRYAAISGGMSRSGVTGRLPGSG